MWRISCIALLILLASTFGSAAQQSEPSSGGALDRQLDAGFSAYARGQNAEAKRTFESVRAALEPLAVPQLELAVALNMLTAIDTREHFRVAEWDSRAREVVSRVVEIVETTLGPIHSDLIRTLALAAGIYRGNDRAKATATQERWLGLLVQTLGPNHPKVAASRLLRRISQIQPPDPQGVRSLAQQAVTLQETSGPQPEIADVLLDLTRYLQSKEEQLPLVQLALAIRRAVPRQPYLGDVYALGRFILLQAELGRPLDAALLAETVDYRDRALKQLAVAPSESRYVRSLEALEQAMMSAGLARGLGLTVRG